MTLIIQSLYFASFFNILLSASGLRPHRLFCNSLYKVCSKMDAYESHPSHKKPVLSNPTGVFHFFFYYQVQIQSCFFLKTARRLLLLGLALWWTCKSQTIQLSGIVLRNLEDRAAFDSVPPQMYEPN